MQLITLLALSALTLSAMCSDATTNSTVIDAGKDAVSSLNATANPTISEAPIASTISTVSTNNTNEHEKIVKKDANSQAEEPAIANSDKKPETQPQTPASTTVPATDPRPVTTQSVTPPQEQTPLPIQKPDEQTQPKRGWFDWIHVPEIAHRLLLISAITSMFVFVFIIGLSAYYRFYLLSKKKAPFTAPAFLSFLFPRPTNYETEISALCSKYMNEP